MDNTREKLIELFKQEHARCIDTLCSECKYDTDSDCGVDALVDHLIANGITLDNQVSSSKWIPVTERLPEKWQDIIAYDEKNQEIHLAYMTEDSWVGVRMNGKVTHWMPLPEPPKGE